MSPDKKVRRPHARCPPPPRLAAPSCRVHGKVSSSTSLAAPVPAPLPASVLLAVAPPLDARHQLLTELAAGPARRAYAIAYDLLGDRAEAEEAVQESLARACERIGDLRDPAAAPAWLWRIVTTTCLRVLRRRRLRRALFGRFERARPEPGGATPPAPLDDEIIRRAHAEEAADPGAALDDGQQLADLVRSLDDLPSKQRAALLLRYGQGLPVANVASMLGVEVATAKTHLVRGLARLRAHLSTPGPEKRS
jgi:RNA polymerase sigma-70 factor (ECF subfamily)